MAKLFGDFDFKLLDDPDFREDSVREALVVPLVTALGFTESPPYRIIRSRPLTHPYVYIGTVKRGITIIPDYLLQREGENTWILDAKGPEENIDSGKNVEQAYSYAIHPDIRVPFYGLCNGRKLVVFNISYAEPVIDVPLQDIERIWPMVVGILGCRSAWPNGIAPGFSPDFGLAMAKAGFAEDGGGKKYYHTIMSVAVKYASKIKDDLYSVSGHYGLDHQRFIVTFDFGLAQYQLFLAELLPDLRDKVRAALSEQPFSFFFQPSDAVSMMIAGELGDKTYTNENESYRPFTAEKFVREPEGIWGEVSA